MREPRIGRRIACLGVLAWPAVIPISVRAQPPDDRSSGSLAGQLLVASDEITDPRFTQSVILMVQHGDAGALGIVINRLIEERSLASLLDAIGKDATDIEGTVRIFAGGPVQPDSGFVLHTADYRRPDTIDIDVAMSMTSDPEILVDIGHSKGPLKSLIAFGYAGWGPNQLESELQIGGWIVASADPTIVFDADRDTLWDQARKRRTVPL